MRILSILAVSLSLFLLSPACDSQRSPREVAIEFVGAVVENDSLALADIFDIDSMVKRHMQEVPTEETPAEVKDQIWGNLLNDGGTREFWKKMTAVVGDEVVVRDTAQVEVTFLDREFGKYHHYNIYLYHSDKGWRVFYFL